MPESDAITSRLKATIEERFAIDMRFVDASARLGDLGIDSLHVVDLLLDIESELGFNFENVTLPGNPTLGELSAAIAANLQPPAGS
ncbi:MAG: acyl carrier protein [Janthinobacterium lividum]